MTLLHEGQRLVFDLLLGPLGRLGPRATLVVVSVVSGALLMMLFRLVTNPRRIRRARNQVQAQLLAVRLYRHDLGTFARAQGAFFRNLGVYMARMIVPFLVLLVPFGALFAQLDARYGSRALHPGESAIVRMRIADGEVSRWHLEPTEGFAIEAGPVRIPALGEVVWRIRAAGTGAHALRFRDGTSEVRHPLVVAKGIEPAVARRYRAGGSSLALAAAAPSVPSETPVSAVEIGYPWLPLRFLGIDWSWITVFLVVSIVTALALRRRLGVEL